MAGNERKKGGWSGVEVVSTLEVVVVVGGGGSQPPYLRLPTCTALTGLCVPAHLIAGHEDVKCAVLIPGAEHAQVTHLCVAGQLNVASERGGGWSCPTKGLWQCIW